MIIVDNALIEIESEEKEMLWEAIMIYHKYCSKRINEYHCASDIFKERVNMCNRFIEKAFVAWERSYH